MVAGAINAVIATGGVVAAIEVYELSEKIVNHDC